MMQPEDNIMISLNHRMGITFEFGEIPKVQQSNWAGRQTNIHHIVLYTEIQCVFSILHKSVIDF